MPVLQRTLRVSYTLALSPSEVRELSLLSPEPSHWLRATLGVNGQALPLRSAAVGSLQTARAQREVQRAGSMPRNGKGLRALLHSINVFRDEGNQPGPASEGSWFPTQFRVVARWREDDCQAEESSSDLAHRAPAGQSRKGLPRGQPLPELSESWQGRLRCPYCVPTQHGC